MTTTLGCPEFRTKAAWILVQQAARPALARNVARLELRLFRAHSQEISRL
jgi:hypothetical protein